MAFAPPPLPPGRHLEDLHSFPACTKTRPDGHPAQVHQKKRIKTFKVPLGSEEGDGFLGRSAKLLPSILSFLSAALGGEVSMADGGL